MPEDAPEHCTIAVPFQQPTTVVPRSIWSLIFAGSGFPAGVLTVTVHRHGWSTIGFGVDVVRVARTGVAGDTLAVRTPPARMDATSTRIARS